jgi:amidase
MDFSGFLELLNGDMKRDLKTYLKGFASDSVSVKSVADVMKFNSIDSLLNMPYNQARLDGIVEQNLTDRQLDSIRQKLILAGKSYFNDMLDTYDLDAVISINNYNAGQAGVAKYPAIAVPMGYTIEGEPKAMTFITKSDQEGLILKIAKYYEQISQFRTVPENYN